MARYLIAAFAARLADAMWVGPVLLVLHRTGSASQAGLVLAAATLPTLVTAPLLGAWLDASGRRRVLLSVHLVVLASALGAMVLGAPAILCTLLAGALQPLVTGGFSSLVPALGGGPRAAGLDSMTYNVASVLGPAVAGLAAAFAPSSAVLLQAALALVAVPLVWSLPAVAGERRPFAATLRDGMAVLTRHRSLRTVTLVSSLAQVGWGLVNVVAPAMMLALGRGSADAGLLLAAVAAGALAGAAWLPRGGPLAWVIGATVAHGALLAALAIAPSVALAFIAGVPQGVAASAMFRARALWSPERLRAQVFTSAAGLRTGLYAAGAALAGPVLALGPRWAMVIAGATVSAAAAAGSRSPAGRSGG